MQILRIMSQDVRFVSPKATVQYAAEMMRAFDVGLLPVCQGEKLVGVITDRDLTVRVTAAGLSPTVVTVADAMSTDAASCRETDDVREAAVLMEELQVRRLPVVDSEGMLIGIISLADIAERTGNEKLMAEVLEQVCEPQQAAPLD